MSTTGDPPNILLLLTDQHRFDWVGMNDAVPVRTPALNAMADQGVWFRNAVAPSPLCAPSRACLAAGMEYDQLEVKDNRTNFPLDTPTFYRFLRDRAGYQVMGCGKFDLHKPEFSWGTDGTYLMDEWGFSRGIDTAGKWATVNSWDRHGGPNDPYMAYLQQHDLAQTHLTDYRTRREDFPAGTYPTPLPEHAYVDNFVARRGIDLLGDAPTDAPWFLQVNFPGPHDPWDVTESMYEWYRSPEVSFPDPIGATDAMSTADHQAVRRNYAAMVENIDRWLGRFREMLATRGELANTVVIFGSDHGEMLGDHGLWRKKVPYHPSMGVPLIVSGAGIQARGAVDVPVSIIDIYATVLEMAGQRRHPEVQSVSLCPYLEARSRTHRAVVFSGFGPWRSAYDGRFKLILGFDPDAPDDRAHSIDPADVGQVLSAFEETDPFLFDREVDPGERENVASRRADVVERLATRIHEEMGGNVGSSP